LAEYLMNRLKMLAKRALASPRVYEALRSRALRARPVTVLVYHTLGPDDDDFDAWTVVRISHFRNQIAFLRERYDVITLDEALHAAAPSADARPRVVVTFDDGDSGLHAHLLPFVEEAKIPVTVYVATGQVESGRCYWFDRVMNALQSKRPISVELDDYGLGTWLFNLERGERNWLSISTLLDKLKLVAPQVREAAVDAIVSQSRFREAPSFTPLAPLGIEQLRQLAQSSWITIGAHTHCHSLLDRIPLGDAVQSINLSRRLLIDWTGKDVRHFAYPNGNHTRELEDAVAGAQFDTATTAEHGLWDAHTRRFAIPRVPIGRYEDRDRFKLRLIGI
jgi:peptidoglycan/xylan/chitin deacetylase (PgdA/CDA1 family)